MIDIPDIEAEQSTANGAEGGKHYSLLLARAWNFPIRQCHIP